MTEPQKSSSSSTLSSLSASQFGWISAAVLSHLALLSVAVETFLSQSSVRWWIVGAVAIYITALLGVWRAVPSVWKRLTPVVLTISGTGLFLALLAVTAWLPSGQTTGIRLVGQSTPTLLAAVSALAVALSGLALWRVRILPAWARYALGALAVYGVVAFVIGLATATPYAALFHGDSFWTALPWWLQGAFLGGLLLIPLAIIARIIRIVEQLRRKEATRGFMLQAAALAMAFFVALAAVNLPGTPPSETMATADQAGTPQSETNATADPAGTPQDETMQSASAADTPPSATVVAADQAYTPPPSEVRQSGTMDRALPPIKIEDLGALVDLVVAGAGDLPRTEFDPAALVDALDRDPQKLFVWVRDHTWWAPYRGLLRGSTGVMLDRVGSSLDRAVLLGDLMRRAGHTVRLAHTQLPEDRSRELVAKVRAIPEQRRSPLAPKPISAERQRALEAILPKDEKSLQEQIADSRRRTDEARALARSQADQLYAAVQSAATGDATADRRAMVALQDHWWVERNENGKWIAMDVLLPDAKMGDTLAVASQTSEWKTDRDAPSIPETDWHTVQIRVVVERYLGGATTESTVLETTLRPAEVLDRPILLTHMPKPWPERLPDSKTDPNALRNAAVSVKEWVPFLQIGDQLVAQSGFTENGDLIADPSNPKREIAETGGGGFMSGFDEALGGGETASSSVTAEWIDYEIRVPGEPDQRLRRPVFDLLGPVRRSTKAAGFDASTNDRLIERYEALLSSTDIFLQPCDIPEEFLAHLVTKSIVANQAAFSELAREPDPAKAMKLASTLLGRIDIWGPLPSLAFWRSELGGQPRAWFIDRPNVLNYRIGQPAVNADRVATRELIDVAANAIGVRRVAGMTPFEIRMRQGVVDTVAEMIALGSDPGKSENTASIFANAGAGADRSELIDPGDTAAVQRLGWPEDAAARLAEDIDAGFLAVALGQPVSINERQRVGWWRVAPETGETIGVMDTGFHAEEAEYTTLIQHMNALKNFLTNSAKAIKAARGLRVLTPGQSLLLRAAVAAERALAAFESSRSPF